MDLMQNCTPDKIAPLEAQRMVLYQQVYFVAEELDRGRKSFVLGCQGQTSALSLKGC